MLIGLNMQYMMTEDLLDLIKASNHGEIYGWVADNISNSNYYQYD